MKIQVTPDTEGHFTIHFDRDVLSANSDLHKTRQYISHKPPKDSNSPHGVKTDLEHLQQTHSAQTHHLKVLKRGVAFTPIHTDVYEYKLSHELQDTYFKEHGVECSWLDRPSNKDWRRLEEKLLEDIMSGRRDDLLSTYQGRGDPLFSGRIQVIINV